MEGKQFILITGASSGFGFLSAKLLAEKGHVVFASMREANGKNKHKKDELLDWASKHGYDLRVIDLDVTSNASVNNASQEILIQTGNRIDVVINNAGIYGAGLAESFTVQDYQNLYEVNVFGSIRVANAFLPFLRKQGKGLLIQVSSVLGRVVIPFGGPYDSTKFALEAINESLYYELKPLGVDVCIVQPGPFATELVEKIYQPTNQGIIKEYGLSAQLMSNFFANYSQSMSNPDIPNKPQDVAYAILKLVESVPGSRPLRIVVDKMMGGATETINDTASRVQAVVIKNFGLESLQ